MKQFKFILAAVLAVGLAPGAFAQAKEQFFPLLSYRTGPYAPNGTPWANGKQDYLKMINARDGGVNGVKLTWKSARPAMPPTAASNATNGSRAAQA
jgi:branched-chain amino acid transport system substrate-binding protein